MHLSVSSNPPRCVPFPPLPQCTRRPWTRPRDHLRERGDPLCYVSAREWNNTESSSANNSQWRSFSTCCLTKGKIRTDDRLSFSLLGLERHSWLCTLCGGVLSARRSRGWPQTLSQAKHFGSELTAFKSNGFSVGVLLGEFIFRYCYRV